jgi:hypothetical protein
MIGLRLRQKWWSIVSKTLGLLNVCTEKLSENLNEFGDDSIDLEHSVQCAITRKSKTDGS